MATNKRRSQAPRGFVARLLAVFMVSIMSLAGISAIAPAAHADTQGISVTALHNGEPMSDGAVVNAGNTLTLQVQYDDALDASSPVVIGPPEGVTVDESSLEVPAGNDAIDDVSLVDGQLHIDFYDVEEWDSQQGVYGLDFTFDQVEGTESQTIEWTVDGEPSSIEVTVQDPDDEQEDVSNWLNKDADWVDLSQHVSVDDGAVELDEALLEESIDYTLNVNTESDADRSQFTIADEISEYLSYNDDFSAQITTWDEDGWNQETNDFDFSPSVDGNSFTGEVDVDGPSELTINYSASINSDQMDALRDELQEEYDEIDEYGDFTVSLGNTVDFGGEDADSGNVDIGGSIDEPAPAPVPEPDQAFNKDASPSDQNVEPEEDGALNPPADVTYTFDADLSQWDGEADEDHDNHEDFELDRNVVISDNLPEGASWNTDADDFINADGLEITEAVGFDGSATDFEADEYVGSYAVVGQNLFINVGQDEDTDATITALAQATTVDVDPWPWEQPDTGFVYYNLENSAEFAYTDEGDPYTDSVEVDLIDRGDTEGGVEIPEVFSKTSEDTDGPVYIEPGESVTLDYTFVVNDWGDEAVDVTNSYIIDYRDSNVFDFSDLDEIQSNISGEYDYWQEMGPEHFELSLTDDGHLRIDLSEEGIEFVGEGSTDRLEINVPLNTVEFEGRQTVEIENNATLYGSDDEALYWSETTSEASSFGDEAETQKSIRDTPNEDWTQNLRVEVDENDELIQDEFVYNLGFIPHGDYNAVEISPVEDELPEEVEFIGFVGDDDVDTGDNPENGPVDIGGNLEAVYDDDAHSVTVQQQEGTLLEQEPGISANVLVQVTDFEVDVPVANFFGPSSANFTPSDGYPISINKVDAEDDEVIISDPDSRFNVLDEDDEIVVEDAFAEDGLLWTHDDDGDPTGLVVPEPGTYYVEETVAPEGYELSTEQIEVTVDEDGSSEQESFPNVPTDEEPEPEVGDFSVVKDFEDPEGVLEEDAAELEFTVEYSYEDADGEDASGELTVLGDGEPVASEELAAGTEVALSEVDLPEVEGAQWGAPEFSEETVTVEEGETVEVTLTNPISPEEEPEPEVEIVKGDGDAEEGTIENDANTEDDAVAYEDGETRDIVINVENTGDEDLVDVVLTDETVSGDAQIEDLVWTTPDGTELEAEADEDGVLTANWDGSWAVGDQITGVASLTLDAGGELHTNLASVEAEGAGSGTSVDDDDPYNATPPEPEDPEDPKSPEDPEDPKSPGGPEPKDPEGEDPDEKDDEGLAITGTNTLLTVGALALALLLIGGGLLLARRVRAKQS